MTLNKQIMENKQKLASDLQKISSELDACVKFWTQHSHDEQHGWGHGVEEENIVAIIFSICSGFFNCLSADGSVYDTTKYCWLQGRWGLKRYRIQSWWYFKSDWKYMIGVWLTFQASSWSDLTTKLQQFVMKIMGFGFHLMMRRPIWAKNATLYNQN